MNPKIALKNVAEFLRVSVKLIFKDNYDVVVIDCQPNLRQSVARITIGIVQVIPLDATESYSNDSRAARSAIAELEEPMNMEELFV